MFFVDHIDDMRKVYFAYMLREDLSKLYSDKCSIYNELEKLLEQVQKFYGYVVKKMPMSVLCNFLYELTMEIVG